jgi:uncharacterized protein YjbI with pentapeptide repeats
LARARAGRPPRTGRAAEQQGGGLDWARQIELASVIIASLVAVVGLWYSNVQNREANNQARQDRALSKEGQVTDRYTAAVTNLGDKTLDVRLGGIYALQRIMQDSPRDHPTIANVLTAYIRTHAGKAPAKGRPLPADVSAALTVLADRNPNRDGKFKLDLRNSWLPDVEVSTTVLDPKNRIPLAKALLRGCHLSGASLDSVDLREADLVYADLHNASLSDADLSGARLSSADLSEAYLRRANLRNTWLYGADLRGATLWRANLRDSELQMAKLSGAYLADADLRDADLSKTDLRGADLRGADLRRTFGLKAEGLVVTDLDSRTKLPAALAKDPAVRSRIAEVERLLGPTEPGQGSHQEPRP